LLRLSENAHLPFGKPFDKPFDKLTVLSKVEGLTVLSKVDGLMAMSKVDPSTQLRVDAEQCRRIEGLRYPPQDFGSLAPGHFPSAS
jgi:hypothetical protein